MIIEISQEHLEDVMDCLYSMWDMAREDLEDDRAEQIRLIRDKILLPQYNKQLSEEY